MDKTITVNRTLYTLLIIAVLVLAGFLIYGAVTDRLRKAADTERIKLLESENEKLAESNKASKNFQDALLTKVDSIAVRRDSVYTKLIFINQDHENKIAFLLGASDSAKFAFFTDQLSKLE